VDARRELVADIARVFGVPTRLANAPASDDETYANVESEGLDLLRYCLGDYMAAISDAITGLLPPGRTMRLDPTAVTRGLQGDRYTAWSTAVGGKPWMLPEEIREAEHLAPLEADGLSRLGPAAVPPPLSAEPGGAALAEPLERTERDAVAVS
jgi:phage portal protein BeeE